MICPYLLRHLLIACNASSVAKLSKGAKIAYNDAGFSSAAEGCKPEMLKFCTEFSL